MRPAPPRATGNTPTFARDSAGRRVVDRVSTLAVIAVRLTVSNVNWRIAVALATLLLAAGFCPAAEGAAPESAWRRVEIGATWTSIYVGTVSLRMPEFKRNAAGEYESTYAARVLPWLFQNENGRISIRVSDDALRRLARGETIEFDGRAVNQAGEERAVTGRAAPADATSGRIKVRVGVSPKVELIFNTTYRFSGS